jgi:hypothetical protein
MRDLDTSIANQNILDDAFSNVVGMVNLGSGTPLRPTSGNTAIAVRPLEPKVSSSTLVAPSVINAPKEPTVTETPQVNPAPMQPIIFGGGGGGAPEEQIDSSKKEAAVEKTIFGLKPIVAYGIGAAALAFVYFKFIKK